jgi:hypothetical protein
MPFMKYSEVSRIIHAALRSEQVDNETALRLQPSRAPLSFDFDVEYSSSDMEILERLRQSQARPNLAERPWVKGYMEDYQTWKAKHPSNPMLLESFAKISEMAKKTRPIYRNHHILPAHGREGVNDPPTNVDPIQHTVLRTIEWSNVVPETDMPLHANIFDPQFDKAWIQKLADCVSALSYDGAVEDLQFLQKLLSRKEEVFHLDHDSYDKLLDIYIDTDICDYLPTPFDLLDDQPQQDEATN